LIELENLETTEKLIEWFEWDNSGLVLIEGRHELLEYCKNQTLNSETDRNSTLDKIPPSPVLLLFVRNCIYPIALDILSRILKPGNILWIVIFYGKSFFYFCKFFFIWRNYSKEWYIK
jgi:hypothetical protein